MKKDQISRIEEMLMIIPTKMCRNMDQRFVNYILKDISADLAKHHFMIMKMLQEKEKFYVTEVVQVLNITKSQMTASVDKLLKMGFVERWADTSDRRKIYLSITKKGNKITKKISTRIKERFHEDIQILNQDDLNDLEKGLKALAKFCANCEN